MKPFQFTKNFSIVPDQMLSISGMLRKEPSLRRVNKPKHIELPIVLQSCSQVFGDDEIFEETPRLLNCICISRHAAVMILLKHVRGDIGLY